jgi:hypothetical protein
MTWCSWLTDCVDFNEIGLEQDQLIGFHSGCDKFSSLVTAEEFLDQLWTAVERFCTLELVGFGMGLLVNGHSEINKDKN